MTDDPLKSGTTSAVAMPLIEPVHIPVQIIDAVTTFGMVGGTINITLATNRIGRSAEGKPTDELVVAARLRFDPHIGKMIRDAIDAQLTLLSTPKENAN